MLDASLTTLSFWMMTALLHNTSRAVPVPGPQTAPLVLLGLTFMFLRYIMTLPDLLYRTCQICQIYMIYSLEAGHGDLFERGGWAFDA